VDVRRGGVRWSHVCCGYPLVGKGDGFEGVVGKPLGRCGVGSGGWCARVCVCVCVRACVCGRACVCMCRFVGRCGHLQTSLCEVLEEAGAGWGPEGGPGGEGGPPPGGRQGGEPAGGRRTSPKQRGCREGFWAK